LNLATDMLIGETELYAKINISTQHHYHYDPRS